MMFPKRKPYENQKIRDSAKGEECTMNAPGCNYDPSTVVWCHINADYAGKGMSQKADDLAGFYGCAACHWAYDHKQLGNAESWYVLRAMVRSMRRLLDKGVIR